MGRNYIMLSAVRRRREREAREALKKAEEAEHMRKLTQTFYELLSEPAQPHITPIKNLPDGRKWKMITRGKE